MSQVEVNRGVSPDPRKPGRWTWAVVGRLCSRTLVAFALVWVVALVGWPVVFWPAGVWYPEESVMARATGRGAFVRARYPTRRLPSVDALRRDLGATWVQIRLGRWPPATSQDSRPIVYRDANLRVLLHAITD